MKEDLLVAPWVVALVVVVVEEAQRNQSLMEKAELNLPEPENQSVSEAGKLSNSSLWSVLLAKVAYRFNLNALFFQTFPKGACPQTKEHALSALCALWVYLNYPLCHCFSRALPKFFLLCYAPHMETEEMV